MPGGAVGGRARLLQILAEAEGASDVGRPGKKCGFDSPTVKAQFVGKRGARSRLAKNIVVRIALRCRKTKHECRRGPAPRCIPRGAESPWRDRKSSAFGTFGRQNLGKKGRGRPGDGALELFDNCTVKGAAAPWSIGSRTDRAACGPASEAFAECGPGAAPRGPMWPAD